ncbi:MAG TPA: hypothetical protein VFS40_10645 [Gemmatimonadales bacterium]|nr:hypothetical protein [Gemmatimonadales bacterium]
MPTPPRPDAAALALLHLLPRAARGPRREGVFALWLTVRVATDLLEGAPPAPGEERRRGAPRRRLLALEQRLSSLTLPPPLRRALTAAIAQLRDPRPDTVALVLGQLVAPARDTVGAEAGEALALAARGVRARLQEAAAGA